MVLDYTECRGNRVKRKPGEAERSFQKAPAIFDNSFLLPVRIDFEVCFTAVYSTYRTFI